MKTSVQTSALIIIILNSCAASVASMSEEGYPGTDTYYHPDGTLEEVFCKSSVPGPEARRTLVYLPEGYDESGKDYPVLYLLHGANGNETSWIMKGMILREIDNLVKKNEMEEAIVVFPNMNQYDNDADYGFSRAKGPLESFLGPDGTAETCFIRDVVTTIDSLYRTVPVKEMRAIAGLSMGGMQSIHISASYPDMFGYIGLFSPFVTPPHQKSEYSDFYHGIRNKLKEQFKNPPCMYWIMIGRMDFFCTHMDSFSSYLNEHGYPHTYIVTKGGHEWYNWVDYCNRFMKEIFRC